MVGITILGESNYNTECNYCDIARKVGGGVVLQVF